MSIGDVLNKLERVRSVRKQRWMACCPAHGEKTPSLSIRELDDGRVLLHCFGGGCGAQEVLDAIGLTMDAIMPERVGSDHKLRRVRYDAVDALEALQGELMVAALILGDIAKGEPVTQERAHRIALAAGRVTDAVAMVKGK